MQLWKEDNGQISRKMLIFPKRNFLTAMSKAWTLMWKMLRYYFTEPEIFRAFHLLHWPYLLSQVLLSLRNLVFPQHFFLLKLTHKISACFLAFITSLLASTEIGKTAQHTGNLNFFENFWKPHVLLFFSPPATVVFILFLLFEVKLDDNISQSELFGVILSDVKSRMLLEE